MARDANIKLEGVVTETSSGIVFVKTEQFDKIVSRISGKMKKAKIRVMAGDKVFVEVSPYDPTKGIIVTRL